MADAPNAPASLARQIPKVDTLLAAADMQPLLERFGRAPVLAALRDLLERLRQRALEGALPAAELAPELTPEIIAAQLAASLAEDERPYYRRVINGTGVVLHTNLGRAPLAAEAVSALVATAAGGQRLELELETGRRGGRDRGCADLLCRLLGAEAATVVNNNAAATLLILAALARGRGVVLSRGEMVEIGGSYRIPEILEESGARLVEVGTTNRTHERDYRRALEASHEDSATPVGLLLKVHTSNYRVVGFTGEVGLDTLVDLGREYGVPVVHDLGSGCLVDLEGRGFPGEAQVQRSLAAGADLVCCSGDKLLGGPQAGILAGKARAVERCRKHPLFRALRPGRLTYTALEATLRLYLRGEDEALQRVPALRRLTAEPAELKRRAGRWARRLAGLPGLEVGVAACSSQAGSGSLPARDYPSWALRLLPVDGGPEGLRSAEDLAAALRRGEPAIIGRLHDDALLLDLRTLEDEELRQVESRLRELFRA